VWWIGVRPTREVNMSFLEKLVRDMCNLQVSFGSTSSQANILLGQISSSPASLPVALQLGLLLFEQKISSKMISLGMQVHDLLPFSSPLKPLLAALDYSFLILIYMIYNSQSKMCFPAKILILRVLTPSSLYWFLMSLTTLPLGSMIQSKTLVFSPTTKMTFTLLKVTITGYYPWGTQCLPIIHHTLGLGSNSSFGWLVKILCLPSLFCEILGLAIFLMLWWV
jgi:hypothetical protein